MEVYIFLTVFLAITMYGIVFKVLLNILKDFAKWLKEK